MHAIARIRERVIKARWPWRFSALLLFCFSALVASADTLADLASPSFDTRRRATEALLADPSMTLDRVAALYGQAASPEQRHRLIRVARHLFVKRVQDEVFPPPGKGAIGMSHETVPAGTTPGIDGPAVHVMRTLPGFPAFSHLRVDDLIVGFDGVALPRDMTDAGFTPLIEGRGQGDPIELDILRDGRRQTIQMELASAAALGTLFNPGTLDLRPPFRGRWLAVRSAIVDGRPIPPLNLVDPTVPE